MRSLYRIDYKSNKKGVVQKGKTELVKVIDCNKTNKKSATLHLIFIGKSGTLFYNRSLSVLN